LEISEIILILRLSEIEAGKMLYKMLGKKGS